mgnify:CR=1 FL=1
MAKLKFEIPLDPEVVLDIITSAHDANACNYFLMAVSYTHLTLPTS